MKIVPESAPRWDDIVIAFKKKYGNGKVPCGVYDAARDKYYQDFMLKSILEQGYNPELSREAFMKYTDLPTTWTLTGRKRQGCAGD